MSSEKFRPAVPSQFSRLIAVTQLTKKQRLILYFSTVAGRSYQLTCCASVMDTEHRDVGRPALTSGGERAVMLGREGGAELSP